MFEFASMEWIWTDRSIRVNLPGNQEYMYTGYFDEVVAIQNDLGAQGWDVATSVASANWIYWTLRRSR
ncbi:hypothetical protein [Actinocorallia populi]|uniref:hypothetical protein n=1 Tax=Actinocorallia populi TaxID=2079200 RepID=UPI000D09794F|nr:hypothetical protein [Actinocorallia populi]